MKYRPIAGLSRQFKSDPKRILPNPNLFDGFIASFIQGVIYMQHT
jgi:hypothetical protein